MIRRPGAGLVALAMLSACTVVPTPGVDRPAPPRQAPQPAPPPAAPRPAPAPAPPKPTSAAASGVQPGPSLPGFQIRPEAAKAALLAFRASCPGLQRRADASGLTRAGDWTQPCAQAVAWPDGDALNFFANQLAVVQVGDGQAFVTGYYEPEIAGSRTPAPGYDVPVYKRPPDLVEGDLGDFFPELKGKKIRGKVEGNRLVPYPDRGQIEDGALKGRGLEIGWAADPVEYFFLQVQGSGRLRLPDGSVMRIGYDSQNGRDYTGIGALMRDRGMLQPGHATMQDIVAWLRAHPDEGREVMRANKSYVFFRLLDGPPLGAMGLPVTGGVTVASDPKFIPMGAPVFLSMDRTDATGLWIAQDTGGAIKGANRVDTFWGAGKEAEAIAGGMSGRGTAFLFVPVGTLARLQGGGGGTTPQR